MPVLLRPEKHEIPSVTLWTKCGRSVQQSPVVFVVQRSVLLKVMLLVLDHTKTSSGKGDLSQADQLLSFCSETSQILLPLDY